MAVLAVRDYRGREVTLTEARLAHIRFRHEDLTQDLDAIVEALSSPRLVTRDVDLDHVENHYGPERGRLSVKVCVRYRPVPDPADPRRSAWQGDILTAHRTGRVKPEETPLWP